MKELSFDKMSVINGGDAKLDAAGIVVSCVGGTMLLAATAAVTIVSGGTLGWLFGVSVGLAATSCGLSWASALT